MSKILDSKSFHYRSADETASPGYLKRRFDEIRRKQKAKAKPAKPDTNISQLRTAAGSRK